MLGPLFALTTTAVTPCLLSSNLHLKYLTKNYLSLDFLVGRTKLVKNKLLNIMDSQDMWKKESVIRLITQTSVRTK